MRAYFFGNMYLSSIQQGIQAAHVVGELSQKYSDGGDFTEWASDWKTMILLNAGYSDEIRNLITVFEKGVGYEWAAFHEGKDSLDGALTCVGIILPEKIYGLASYIRKAPRHEKQIIEHEVTTHGVMAMRGDNTESGEDEIWDYTKWDWALVNRLNQYGMAS